MLVAFDQGDHLVVQRRDQRCAPQLAEHPAHPQCDLLASLERFDRERRFAERHDGHTVSPCRVVPERAGAFQFLRRAAETSLEKRRQEGITEPGLELCQLALLGEEEREDECGMLGCSEIEPAQRLVPLDDPDQSDQLTVQPDRANHAFT